MSFSPLKCPNCQVETVGGTIAPFPNGAFAVSWVCPKCNANFLDICPFGPLVPEPGICLNCGAQSDAEFCETCGINAAALEDLAASSDPISEANELAQQFLLRRALAVLNHALVKDESLLAAWTMKCSILDQLGFFDDKLALLEAISAKQVFIDVLCWDIRYLHKQGQSARALEVAEAGLAVAEPGLVRGRVLEEISWLHAETGDGQKAYDYARRASTENPDSSLADYLLGRAAGLLGRLDEARVQVEKVLASPDQRCHQDARRALEMIEAWQKQKKPWWKLW
jgi:tetratricopeptide (TPR) repeat protein